MTSVCFDLSILRHPEGGTARYARRLYASMLEGARPSDRLVAVRGLPRAPRGTSVRRYLNAAADLAWFGPIATLLARLHRTSAWYSPAGVLPVMGVGATIVTIHDVNPLLDPAAHDARYVAWATRMLRRSAVRADRILADSAFTARTVREVFGIDDDKVSVAYPGVDHALDERPEPADDLPQRYALFVGQTEVHKNVELLLDAWRIGVDGLHLVIAGRPGRADQRLRRVAAEAPLRSRVTFLGAVSDPRLAGLYARARCFLFPSRLEGFGLPPLEAMAHGVPTAVADRTSLPEVTRGAALLFDPDDAPGLASLVRRLDQDEELRARLAIDGRRVSAGYRWAETADAVWTSIRWVAGDA